LFCGPLPTVAGEGVKSPILPFIVHDLHTAYRMSDGFLPAYQRNEPKNTGIGEKGKNPVEMHAAGGTGTHISSLDCLKPCLHG
jgi:hypothetical protein